ncbi:SAM-dependent methyltransferase [Streptomyces sp. 184]|uniref:SAM-dependent methyltransferase n=1 Tax=Streptomyces sp. 184 TaxID=1827526 RepID=UPI0038927CAF
MTAADSAERRPAEEGGPGSTDGLRTDQPHAARMYDYLLGGTDYFASDRAAADQAVAAFPTLRTAARENRRFLGRAVRHLVEQVGIRQFLDIGSGLPTAENVHQVARRYAPDVRVVYVDSDPLVLAHGQALLAEDHRTTVIRADAREPETVLGHSATRRLLDFSQPIGVLAVALLHFIGDKDDPAGIVRTLRGAVVPGSHFVLSHATADVAPSNALGVQDAYRARGVPLSLRGKQEFTEFFTGLELIEPGIQMVSDWRSDLPLEHRPSHADVSWYGGLGRLP